MGKTKVMKTKGWFTGLGRAGDRDLADQMIGLEPLLQEVGGKTVLDAGCAEGLISLELAKAGAAFCLGLEIAPRFVEMANAMASEQGLDTVCVFTEANLNTFRLTERDEVDIVLMLAVLHKLKDPSRVCGQLADLAKELCVIRLPPSGPVIRDERSGFVMHDMREVMEAAGFDLEAVVPTTRNEWLGYFRRIRRYSAEPIDLSARAEEQLSAPKSMIVQGERFERAATTVEAGIEVSSSVTPAPESGTEAMISETQAAKSETQAAESETAQAVAETADQADDSQP